VKGILKFSCLANVFEWYEFVLFAYLATAIAHNFFQSESTATQLIQVFFVFSSSYLIRPIGSYCFGYIGDKYTPALAVKIAMVIMAIPTILIGLLPSYAQLGVLAPILLILLRLIQGFAAGGELPLFASYLYGITKHSEHRTFLCGLVNIGGMIGVLLASLTVFLLHQTFESNTIQNWAWRIPFLCALPLSIFIIWSRYTMIDRYHHAGVIIQETHVCQGLNVQFLTTFLKAFVMMSFLQVSFYLLFVWMPSYLEVFGNIPHHIAKTSNTMALLTLLIMTVMCSYLSKYIDYKKLIISSIVLSIVLTIPLFLFLNHHLQPTITTITLSQILFAIINAPIQGTYLYAICHSFTSGYANRGISLSYTLPTALFGGTAPLICSYVIHSLGLTIFPGVYIVIFAILALLAVILL